MVQPRKISDIKPIFSNLAQTSHYQVIFGGLSYPLVSYLISKGIDSRFIGETVGLLCSSTSLPGSQFATADITGNFTGITEKFAHTRTYNQIDMEFYVDSDYRTLKFFEHWMEFMSSGSEEYYDRPGYHVRMRYPNEYKVNRTKIIKFDKDYRVELEYNFYGLFPLVLNPTPVNYGSSEVLKANATFHFDRYVTGKVSSFDFFRGEDNNNFQIKLPKPTTSNAPRRVPVSPGASGGSGVTFRPADLPLGTAIVQGELYSSIIGERRAF